MARKLNDNLDLAGNQITQVILENLAADPGSNLGDGRLWYDTVLDAVRVRANGATVSLATSAGAYSAENAQDDVAAAFAAGTQTGITVTYNDGANSFSLAVVDDETTQDIIGANVIAHTTAATAGGIVATYDDAGTGRTMISWAMNEAAQDLIGNWLPSGAGSSGITVTYDDAGNKMNYVVGGVAPAAITFAATDKLLGRDTASGGAGEEIGLGASLEFSGSGTIQRAALTGDVTAAANSNATAIGANKVLTTMIADANVTLAKLANIATDSLIGRDTAGSGVPEVITLDTTLTMNGSQVLGRAALTGDVTTSANAATIPNNTVTNAKAADMAAHTIKGNNTGSTADPIDLSLAQVKSELAYNGTEIVFTPTGNIASTNVSAAIAELETDLTAVINAAIQGQTWKDPVVAHTTGALPNSPTYASGPGTLTAGSNTTLAAQDGVTVAVGERLLVKDQASTFQNGIYTLTAAGSGAAPWVLTRAVDANTAAELSDATVLVAGGTTGIGDIYTQVNTLADLTAAAQSYVKTGEGQTQFTSDGTTIELVGNSFRIAATAAGNGLSGGGGSALAVNVSTGLEISSDNVRIAAHSAGGLTGGAGSALAVNTGSGLEISSNTVRIATGAAGTGLSGGGGSALSVNHAVVPYLYATATAGGATSEVITHNLGTRDVIVTVYGPSGSAYAEEDFTVEHTSTNTVTIRSTVNIPASYRVVVLG